MKKTFKFNNSLHHNTEDMILIARLACYSLVTRSCGRTNDFRFNSEDLSAREPLEAGRLGLRLIPTEPAEPDSCGLEADMLAAADAAEKLRLGELVGEAAAFWELVALGCITQTSTLPPLGTESGGDDGGEGACVFLLPGLLSLVFDSICVTGFWLPFSAWF